MYLDGRFRFDNYVVGSANRLAVAAARAVAESPGAVYNPLFIYSSSGLGKTHLIGAIGYHARQQQPELTVQYVTVDDFVEQLHVAVSTGQSEPFRQRYKQMDLLLLDDVQFLTGRRETQSELLRLFNLLQGSNRQIVMTSDRPPSEIADVDERLVTRLAGGLIVDIGAPDFETKVAILRNVCQQRDMTFMAGVLEELAQLEYASVREMQGALTRLAAHQSLGEGEVTPAVVRRLLGERQRAARLTPSMTGALGDGEYLSFVADVAAAVASTVESWKAELLGAIDEWGAQGYRTTVLERALAMTKAPNVEGLLGTFAQVVQHLRALEDEAAALDPGLRALTVFRDPEQVAAAETFVQRLRDAGKALPRPSADFPRERYVVSGCNQLAVRAADAVIADPGMRYNPLFVHGPSGVGKTHLLHAIGVGLQRGGMGRLVACVSAPAFVDELIVALQQGGVEAWRARYRGVDALLIDDVHFVADKERTQEELFHIFNALAGSGRQIVLASDRPPRELEALADRLRTRFEGGLVAPLQAPDRALREELYRRMLAMHASPVAEDLLAYLADRPAMSVRELQGTFNRLQAAAEVGGVPIALSLARATLEENAPVPVVAPTHLAAASDAFFLDDEKIVWDWPDVSGRAIEDLR